MQWIDVDRPTFTRICKSAINWLDYGNSFSGIQTNCLMLMTDYLHPGKTTTGQYYAEPAFKLLDVIKQNNNQFNGPLSRTTRVSRYQKGKTDLDFTEARDSEWQCHQLGHMQVCISLQADNHASTPPLRNSDKSCHLGVVSPFHDNAPAHKSLVAQQALCNCEFVQLNHPAYSPDLAPSDYFIVRNLKYRLHGT